MPPCDTREDQSVTEPNKKLFDDTSTRTITINDVKWPVPKLAPRQNEIVVPLILKLVPKLLAARQERDNGDGTRTAFMDLGVLATVLTGEGMRELGEVVFRALERGHRDLTREEFDDMPMGTLEMVEAVVTIARQTGVIRQTAEVGGTTKGEGAAAEAPQTGAP